LTADSFSSRRLIATIAALPIAGVFAGCTSNGSHPSAPPGATIAKIAVTSTAFATGGPIPIDYTCDGADRSPPLAWGAVPDGTQTIAVVADDPDAPGGVFTHWIEFDVQPNVSSLAEGAGATAAGGVAGTNDFQRVGYSGPCPPKAELHHYFFRVFALNAPIRLRTGAARSTVESAMSGHVLAEGALVGTFSH
jgi:Raf kinase inhibitor-like YbhB/YbcL family protein